MNTPIVTHIIRLLLVFALQVFILNDVPVAHGVQFMIYPLFIFLLPVEINIFYLMLIAFGFGSLIDIFSNTFGMHASALMAFAYFRPIIFKLFAPSDGYDILLETNLLQMGFGWFLRTFGILLLIHHFWFFMLEIFRITEIVYVLKMTGLSVIGSFVLSVLFQYLFLRKPRKET